MNLNELLDASVARWPQKPAVIEGETVVSYLALAEIISEFEKQLTALSLPAGCRVGLQVPNSLNYIALTYALWRIRAVVIPVPAECPPDEVAEIATQMQLELMLSTKPLAGGKTLSPEIYFARLTPKTAPDNHGLNIAFIRFTSGTTSARTPAATLRPRAMSAASRRSSIRPLVHEPMKTVSMAMSLSCWPGVRPI